MDGGGYDIKHDPDGSEIHRELVIPHTSEFECTMPIGTFNGYVETDGILQLKLDVFSDIPSPKQLYIL